MPGRCGYCPGRATVPGCCVRTGCEGSGRGPPGVGLLLGPGYAGRGGSGGRADGGAPGRAAAGAPAAAAGRAVAGAAAGRSTRGCGRGTTRGAGVVGSGGVGVVGRCSSMRRRIVGGTTRPGVGGFTGTGPGA